MMALLDVHCVYGQCRFSHIVVDRVETSVNSVRRVMDVVFVSTFEGVIHKYLVLRPASTSAADSEACLLERIEVTPDHQTIASVTPVSYTHLTLPTNREV